MMFMCLRKVKPSEMDIKLVCHNMKVLFNIKNLKSSNYSCVVFDNLVCLLFRVSLIF